MDARLQQVRLRPVDIEQDVHHLFRWLGDADVNRWYSEGEHSLENYRRTFAPEPTTRKFIIEIEGVPAGYLQAYRLSDEPDYAAQLGLEHDAVSIDLFLGERRGEGWGSVVLRKALEQVVFGEMNAGYACINPDPKNTRAVRSYEKAGFRGNRVVWVQDDAPENTGYERIMLLARDEFL
jgi:aminoglycoside 6'-N-acetyltransferase